MKNSLINIGIIFLTVVFFLVGLFFWPFVAYLTGCIVWIFPFILFLLFCLTIIIVGITQSKKNKAKNNKALGSVFVALLSLSLCNICEALYLGTRYHDNAYIDDVIPAVVFSWPNIGEDYYKQVYVLENPLGFNILPSGVTIRHDSFINDKFVICYHEGESGLYSIEDRKMVVPFGQTLSRNGRPFWQGDYMGVQTIDGIVVIPAKYDLVIMEKDFIIVQKNGKYGCLGKMGNLSIPCEYSGWDKKTDKQGNQYCILEDGYNYKEQGSDKYYIYESEDVSASEVFGYTDYSMNELFATEDKVCEIVTRDKFILADSDHKCYEYYRVDKSSSYDVDIAEVDSDYYGYDSNKNLRYHDPNDESIDTTGWNYVW